MKNGRIYYWDNFKALLIFLVVLGHFLLPIYDTSRLVEIVYYFIYLFHMPAFIFVSGYFAKRYMQKEVPNVNKLLGFLLIYMIYKLLLWVIQSAFRSEPIEYSLFKEGSAPWYLLAMFFWYVFLPLFAQFKASVSVTIALILGCIIGFEPLAGTFGVSQRVIVFLAFFLLGYYFDGKVIEVLTTEKIKKFSIGFLIIIGVVIIWKVDLIDKYDEIVYAMNPYSQMEGTEIQMMCLRIVWYVIAAIITLAVMSLIPRRETVFSYIGARTLDIYVIHRLIREFFDQMDLYRFFDNNGFLLLGVCVIISCIIVYGVSKINIDLFGRLFKINYDKIRQKSNNEKII